MATLNVEELRRVQKHINHHPEQHNQASWGEIIVTRELAEDHTDRWNAATQRFETTTIRYERWALLPLDCGTTACVAGWACLLAGYDPEIDEECSVEDEFQTKDADGGFPVGSKATMSLSHMTDGNGETYEVQALAMDILGLEGSQAAALFSGTNSLEDVNGLIDAWCDDQVTS